MPQHTRTPTGPQRTSNTGGQHSFMQGAYSQHPGSANALQAQQEAAAAAVAQNMRKRNAEDMLVGDGLRGAKKSRPTDRTLPPSLSTVVPESAMYADLQRLERTLDWTVARKRAELQDGMAKPVRTKRTLRIFLSNTASDQPSQKKEDKETDAMDTAAEGSGAGGDEKKAQGDEKKAQGDEKKAQGDQAGEEGIPSWTLRIEGRLLEPTFRSRANAAQQAAALAQRTGAHKFSNLVKTVVVELQRDPVLYPDGSNIIEWHRPTPTAAPQAAQQPHAPGAPVTGPGPTISTALPALDGFEIKRKGSVPVKARIIIYLDHTPERYAVAPELAELLDIKEETRGGIVTALWGYVKHHRLLDEADRRMVRCDEGLKKIFRTDSIAFHHMPEVVNRYLYPPEPVVLEYFIRVDKPHHTHPTAYDIDIEMDDTATRNKQHNVLTQFDVGSEASREIADLDDKIAQAALSIRNSKLKRDFLHSFAQDPHGFIRTWLSSQARDLDTILGGGINTGASTGGTGVGAGIGAEEMRRAETFTQPWIHEAVVVNESQRLAERLQELQNGPTTTGAAAAGGQAA